MTARAAISEREQIAQLREEILWLRAELGLLMDEEQIFEVQRVFRVPRQEARLLLTLINSRLMTNDIAMYGLSQAGYDYETDEDVVKVYVCKLRRRLKPLGVGIETAWGTGYYLNDKARRAIAAQLGQPVAPA